MARKSRKAAAPEQGCQVAVYIRTALYIRLSVEDNKKRGNSVENQRLILNDYLADKPEFRVYDTYIDNGLSGVTFRRPAFQQMLSDIEAGHIDCVVVKDLSRLGRNFIDTSYYIERYFSAHNIRFISVTDQFDTADLDNLHGGIMLPLKNMINEAYALDIGRKIKAQQRQAMQDGEYVGARAPYGYRKAPDNCHKLLIDEDAAKVIRQIFQWAYERAALNDITRRLNEAGIPTPSHYQKSTGEIRHENLVGSGKWQTRTVAKILGSEVYTGDLVQGKTKTVDHRQTRADTDSYISVSGTHEAIVSREVFNAVQEHRRTVCEESRKKKVNSFTPNIFKGKVFCAHCGGSLHRQRNTRKKGPDVYFFHCLSNSRIAKGSCEGVMIREDELAGAVTAILEKELSVVLGSSLSLFRYEERHRQERDRIVSRLSAKHRDMEQNRRLIRGLYEDYVQGIVTGEEYLSLKEDYEKRMEVLTEDMAALNNEAAALDEQLARYRLMEEDAHRLESDRALTADLIERLIDRIQITHGHDIHVAFRFRNEFEKQGKAVQSCENT